MHLLKAARFNQVCNPLKARLHIVGQCQQLGCHYVIQDFDRPSHLGI